MSREGILNTKNDFSADTIANEKAVNPIVIKSCKIDENQTKIILEYNKELVKNQDSLLKVNLLLILTKLHKQLLLIRL